MESINVDGTPVSYRAFGAGEPVVVLHATASSSNQWESLGLGVSQRFKVSAPDFYGHGHTAQWPGQRSFGLSDDVALAGAIVQGQSNPVHLVGHSYGGAVALRLALEQPERFRSLTLVEPVCVHLLKFGDARDRRLYAEVDQMAAAMAGGVLTGHYHDVMRRFVDYWNGEGAWWRMRENRRAELSRHAGTTLLHFTAISSDLTPLAAYRRVNVPTLLLQGRQTPSLSARITDLLASNLRDASKVVVENAGHMLPITHAELVNAAISGHIMEYASNGQNSFDTRRANAA